MSRLREENQMAMSRLREQNQMAMSRLREENQMESPKKSSLRALADYAPVKYRNQTVLDTP
jgi:hypothetical protein